MTFLYAALSALIGAAVITGYWEFGLFIAVAVFLVILLWPDNDAEHREARRRNR